MKNKIIAILIGIFLISLASASNVTVWQGQSYSGTGFDSGDHSFNFTVYDSLTGGTDCYNNITTLTLGVWGQWRTEQYNIWVDCNDATNDYFLNINIDGIDQGARRRLTVQDFLRRDVNDIMQQNLTADWFKGSGIFEILEITKSSIGINEVNLSGVLYVNSTTGNVGIGTASPDVLLNIKTAGNPHLRIEDTTNNVQLKLLSSDSVAVVGTESNHPFGLRSNNLNRIYIEAGGQVGIGTDSPGEKLHVIGNVNFSGTLTTLNIVGQDSAGKLILYGDGGAATGLTIVDDGKVGIGTASPNDPLTVKSSVAGTGVMASFIADDDGKVFTFNKNDNDAGYMDIYDEGGSVDIRLYTQGDSYIMGDVGIGTESPGTLLTLAKDNVISVDTSDASDDGDITIAGGGNTGHTRGGHIVLTGNEASSNAGRVKITAGNIATTGIIQMFTGAGVSRMVIDDSGNVGIGVTPEAWKSTQTALQVGGVASIFGHTSQAAASALYLGQNVYQNSSGNWAYIVNDETSMIQMQNGAFTFKVAGAAAADTIITYTDAMTILNSGNVGIGTTSPASELDVNGTITVTKTGFYYGNTNGNCDTQCQTNEPSGFDTDSGVCMQSWTQAGVPQACSTDGGDLNQCLCVALITA